MMGSSRAVIPADYARTRLAIHLAVHTIHPGGAVLDWSRFGLDRPPFRPAVDTAAYFPAQSHEAALAALAAAFARREPAVLIDGAPGAGKSLVVRKWLDDLLPDVPRVFVPNASAERPAELLQAILFDLGQPYQGLSEQELRLAATAHLLDSAACGFPTVIVLDEAQHLSLPALEELRLLGNLETRQGAVAFAVLVAQPTLRAALARPAYALFADRVAVRCGVEPLSPEESAAYLRHQVSAASGDPAKLLDEEAVTLLASACGGIPRVLNRAAGLAFELCAHADAEAVDVEAAMESLSRLEIAMPEEGEADDAVLLPHPGGAAESRRAGKAKPADGNERATARGSKEKANRRRAA
jgi:type II secretory pathway predicted ATPase ExeA